MANFEIKSIKDIAEGMISKYIALRQKWGDTTPLLEKAAVKSLCWAYAGVAGSVWLSLVWVYKQCFPQTCDLSVLKFWGNLVGVDYNNGQYCTVEIALYDATATTLTAGTVYKDLTTGLIFKTTSKANNENGVITATAQCTTSGATSNLAVGTVLTIANPLDGIPQTAVITSVTVEGTDDEAVETYRQRVLYGFKKKSESGSPIDYYNWVLEVSGIADALVYVLEEGIITVFLVASGSGNQRTPSGELTPNPFPYWVDGNFTDFEGSGQFLQAAYAIEGSEQGMHNRRPVMATVELKAPNYTPFDIEISDLTDISYSETIKNALISVLDDKRPHIVVLDYPLSNAKINQPELSSTCTRVIEGQSFTSLVLKNEEGASISEATLGIGCLAYLRTLTINGDIYYSGE